MSNETNDIENGSNNPTNLLSAIGGESDDGIINKVTSLVKDTYEVAFGGYTHTGYDETATSKYNGSLSEWVEEKTTEGLQFHPLTQSFEPKITGKLEAIRKGSNGNEKYFIDIPAGVITLIGGTGVGKSQLAARMALLLEGEFIRFGEPEVPSIHDPVIGIKHVHTFLNSPKENKFLVWDSLRYFTYLDTKKASIGSGGINNGLYMDLTALNSLCIMAGKTIFLVVNPLVSDKDKVESFSSNLESSVVGSFRISAYGMFTFVARTNQNLRTPISLEFDMSEDRLGSVGRAEKAISKKGDLDDGALIASDLDMTMDPKSPTNDNGWLKIIKSISHS